MDVTADDQRRNAGSFGLPRDRRPHKLLALQKTAAYNSASLSPASNVRCRAGASLVHENEEVLDQIPAVHAVGSRRSRAAVLPIVT